MTSPRRTRLAWGIVRRFEVTGDKVELEVHGRTEKGAEHVVIWLIDVGHLPYVVRALWTCFRRWKKRELETIEGISARMGRAPDEAEL